MLEEEPAEVTMEELVVLEEVVELVALEELVTLELEEAFRERTGVAQGTARGKSREGRDPQKLKSQR